jgi:murein DD-endopeptidase MepM/ murein hydrolase activator NlpD
LRLVGDNLVTILVKYKKVLAICLGLSFTTLIFTFYILKNDERSMYSEYSTNEGKKFIKYVEFNVTHNALERALKCDIESHEDDIKLNWIKILAYLAAKYGGNFKDKYKDSDMDKVVKELKDGKSIEELTKNMKFYNYYDKAYSAVLGEFVGNYKVQVPSENNQDRELKFQDKYGLKAFSPIAKTFPFQHFQDFGARRTFGFSRPHLGHDLMAAVGTPIIAVESGYVEAMGWNKYGGWRIGIRSFDKKRYYYYAHLRKNRPYHESMKEGNVVKAGDVIGYVGRTGYSTKENANNIEISHLHLGMELIFDESQKECDNEIWIDMYSIVELLQKNRSEVVRNSNTKEYFRKYDFDEENIAKFKN